MTDLRRLSVSLTKHGAHKIASLLKQYPASEVLQHLEGSVPGINIERAQAKKNLSAGPDNLVPAVWTEAKKLGNNAIDALTLIAIIFSHYKLIAAMASSSSGPFTGKIVRNIQLKEKEFTNFSHILDQLGYGKETDENFVEYNLESLFKIDGLNIIARKIIEIKLSTASWDRKNSVIDEAIAQQFHRALSISEEQLKSWLSNGSLTPIENAILPEEDEAFFTSASDTTTAKPFTFAPGHNKKAIGTVEIKAPTDKTTAKLLHNLIQNKLYTYLKNQHGENQVGTEVSTGDGTSIDAVLKSKSEYWFYEIKTATSVKASIRQAIPQLLEYAYWPSEERASRLIIVSHLPASKISEQYLEMLRNKFGIPIYYQQFCLESETLITTTPE